MKCKVPTIVSSAGTLSEYFGDAALYANPDNYKDIAEKMILLFKDEKMRRDLIEKESVQAEKFLQKKNKNILFEIIENTITKNPLN
jgi:glycosyltransferase involved in cell wall biosynthesis